MRFQTLRPARFITQMTHALILWVLITPCARAAPMQRDILDLEKHVIADKTDVDAMLQLARLYILSGEFDDAKDMLSRVLQNRPNDPDVLTELGFLNDAAGRTSEAREYYLQAIAQNPDHPVAYINLGLSYLHSGDTDNAVAAFESAISINATFLEQSRQIRPKGPEHLRDYNYRQVFFLSNLALCYRGLGNLDQALDFLEQARLLAPSDRVINASIETIKKQRSNSTSSALVTADQLSVMARLRQETPPADDARPIEDTAVATSTDTIANSSQPAPAPMPEQIRKSIIRESSHAEVQAPDTLPITEVASAPAEYASSTASVEPLNPLTPSVAVIPAQTNINDQHPMETNPAREYIEAGQSPESRGTCCWPGPGQHGNSFATRSARGACRQCTRSRSPPHKHSATVTRKS